MRLPELDPAGSPRVAMPTPRDAHATSNPYVPRMGVPAKRYQGMENPPGVPSRGARNMVKSAPPLGQPEPPPIDYSVGGHRRTAHMAPQHDAAAESAPTGGGAMSARTHTEQQSASVGKTRVSSASASLGASPRSQVSDAAVRLAAKKRAERLADSYQTALSREQLLSEQYDKELVAVRENLQKLAANQPADRAQADRNSELRKRAKLERRVAGFEEKLNELDTYNTKLVDMISALRKQNEPHRMAQKRVTLALEKLAHEMGVQKAACHKALDERERTLDVLERATHEANRDENDFQNSVELLKRESEELDGQNRQAESVLAAATELSKRQQCAAMRKSRATKEKLEVRYGYLKTQLEGLDADFGELQRIVGVHFQPSDPASLEQIIQKFVEKEGQIVSLQRYFSLQSDEVETLSSSLTALNREAERADASQQAAAAAAAAAAGSGAKRQPWDEGGQLDDVIKKFDRACGLLETMFDVSGCSAAPTGMALATKGCSTSTIHDFLSHIASRIDAINGTAHSLHEASAGYKGPSRHAHKANETLDSFLKPKGRTAAAPTAASAAGGKDDAAAAADVVEPGAPLNNVRRTFNKEELPSISDLGPDEWGDADQADSARRRRNEAKKGAVDRDKRDLAISAWVQRQQQSRGAQTARPSIRDTSTYRDDEAALPPKPPKDALPKQPLSAR